MSTGLLEQRVNYPNTGYEYGYGKGGNVDADGDGRKEVDCSHLLQLMLKDAGYDIPYRSTSQLATDTAHFDFIGLSAAQPGDIALWTSMHHTGVVETFSDPRVKGTFFGSQTSTGPKSARFGAGSGYWPMPDKYLRPKPAFRASAQAAPASATEPTKKKIKPTLNFEYPIRKASGEQFNEAEELFALLEQEPSGHYLLGNHGFWHGGIHFSETSAPQCVRQQPVRCIADGEVVAYRLNKNYLQSTYTGSTQCTNLRYSSSFCLVRHEYHSPHNTSEGANKGKQNHLVFYSLYMHLLPYECYAPEEEQGPQRVKVINGGWPARNLPMGEAGSEVLGMIPNGAEFVLLEERETADGRFRFSRGRISKGTIGSKKEGDEIWFSSQENGQAIKNSAGKQRLQDVLPPERVRPGYWQGKVRATITAASGVKVHNAPSGEKGGSQVSPNQVLCLGSMVEFDSDKVQWLQLENGQKYPMAECTFVSGQGGLKGAGTLPSTFWICVEDTGKGKMVSRDSVAPTRFESVVPLKTAIKAGDPVGYMGLYENPTVSGGRASKHQVHIEVFTGDTQLQAFLDNQAGLNGGRQYLRLPAGTELTNRSVLDAKPILLPAKGYKLQREHAVPLDKSPTSKDEQGQEWYQVTLLENRQTISGLVKKPTNSSSGPEVVCQYDFTKIGFRIVEEQNSNSDGFLDPENMPAFFKDLYKEIDQFGDSNGTVSPQELKTALRDPDLRERWSKFIALHPTEWHAKSSDAKWQRLNALLKDNLELLKHEQKRIDDLVFWDDAKLEGIQASVLHFHPITAIACLNSSICIPLVRAQEIALLVSTGYEGKAELDFEALAGNFDQQGMSFGIIQWNFGQGTLGPVLKNMRDTDPAVFDACFGENMNLQTLISALNCSDQTAQFNWSTGVQSSNQAGWKLAFKNIGQVERFKAIQLKHAAKYHDNVLTCISLMREISPQHMASVELRTYVALYDLCVQQNNLTKAKQDIIDGYPSSNVTNQHELLIYVCKKRAERAASVWVADCLSRRIGIIQGSTYTATANGLASSRVNPNLGKIISGAVCEL